MITWLSFFKRLTFCDSVQEPNIHQEESSKKETLDCLSPEDRKSDNQRASGRKETIERDVLVRRLRSQQMLIGVGEEIIAQILKDGQQRKYRKGDILIRQGDADASAFLILRGAVQVLINGREMAVRGASECVGELPAIDRGQRRYASVIAKEDVSVLKMPKKLICGIIETEQKKSPLLHNLARISAERLKAMGENQKKPNAIPKVFIGSSKEASCIVNQVKAGLESRMRLEVVPWTDENVFQPSSSSMESLESIVDTFDFAVLILSGDDKSISRGMMQIAPRDNVIFELGLFMGHIGRKRCFYLRREAKMPSDIVGDMYLAYKKDIWGHVDVEDAVNSILRQIKLQGVRK